MLTRVRAILLVAAIILAALAVACSSSSTPESYEFSGTVAMPIPSVKDFELTDHNGERFRLSENLNSASLIFFGYTLCPDICPTTLSSLVRVKRQLGERADEVNVIMVTVDPERDSAGVLRQRLAVFDPEFIGLTGERSELQTVWKDFGVIAKQESGGGSAAGYLVAHSTYTYLVDQEMRLRVTFPFGSAPEDVAADVVHILNNSGSP